MQTNGADAAREPSLWRPSFDEEKEIEFDGDMALFHIGPEQSVTLVVPEDEPIEEPALFYEENAKNEKGPFHLRQNWSYWMMCVEPGAVSEALLIKRAKEQKLRITTEERGFEQSQKLVAYRVESLQDIFGP